jgi:iron complex outermembrane recepter protein
MKQASATILLLIFLFTNAFAQNKIRISVVDGYTKLPLSGATIRVNNDTSASTDSDGLFFTDCGTVHSLSISFVGYQPARAVLSNCENLVVGLQPVNKSLTAVEITASSNPGKSILYQAASTTLLSPVELKRGMGLFLDDAINGNVPGVTMQRRAVSSGQQFNIRGYGNGARGTRGVSSNFDGQGYKVYLNGIPVTDAEGITTMDDLDMASIGQVEIVKGPAGSLYGLAIAGAVNLQTTRPETGKTSIGQEVLLGSYGTKRYTTVFQTASEHAAILVNYGHQLSDGFTIHNASRKDFINMTGDFNINAAQSVSAYFGYSNSYDERSGELTVTQYNEDDYSGNIEYIKRNGHSGVHTVRAGIAHAYVFNNRFSNTTSVFGSSFNSNASSAGGWTDKSAVNFGMRSTFTTRFAWTKNISLSGLTGFETQHQQAQTIGYGMVKNPLDTNATWVYGNPLYWIIGPVNSNVYTTTATSSLFTEWTLTLPLDFSLTAGVGISSMKISLDDRFYSPATPNKTRQYDTAYRNMLSPHIALNKVFSKRLSAYLSYNKGYKAPVSAYFFIPYSTLGTGQSGIVNRQLKPEVGYQFEIGSKGEWLNGRCNWQLALFKTVFSNKMTAVAVPYNNTTTLYSYMVNAGNQEDKGVEALIKYAVYAPAAGFIKSVTPFANLTWSDFHYKNYRFQSIGKTISTPVKDSVLANDYINQSVAGVAKIIVNAGIDMLARNGLYANLHYFYKDGMPITSDGLINTGSYHLLNAKLGFRGNLSKHIAIETYAGINNITSTRYPIAVFVNQLPDAYIAGPSKANYYGGLNLKYVF